MDSLFQIRMRMKKMSSEYKRRKKNYEYNKFGEDKWHPRISDFMIVINSSPQWRLPANLWHTEIYGGNQDYVNGSYSSILVLMLLLDVESNGEGGQSWVCGGEEGRCNNLVIVERRGETYRNLEGCRVSKRASSQLNRSGKPTSKNESPGRVTKGGPFLTPTAVLAITHPWLCEI